MELPVSHGFVGCLCKKPKPLESLPALIGAQLFQQKADKSLTVLCLAEARETPDSGPVPDQVVAMNRLLALSECQRRS